MKLRKQLVRDCLLGLLLGFIISVINYYFLIPENYNYAIPMFFMFFMFSMLFFEYLERYLSAKDSKKKRSAGYFVALVGTAIFALEAPVVALARTTMDGIKWGALFVTLISWSIFFILAVACKPKDLEDT